MQTVYLAGGMKSGWQDKVKQLECFKFIDPRDKEEKRMYVPLQEYAQWDLHFIRKSDIVFVYIEATNPSCIGLAVEAGYAKGSGKTVILVIEPHNTVPDKYLQFVTQVADIHFISLQEGIDYLNSFNI